LRALKRAKGWAKQDLLASAHTDNPAYWGAWARARKETYDRLLSMVEQQGVPSACQWAEERLRATSATATGAGTPRGETASLEDAEARGEREALHIFLQILGVDAPGSPGSAPATSSGGEGATPATVS